MSDKKIKKKDRLLCEIEFSEMRLTKEEFDIMNSKLDGFTQTHADMQGVKDKVHSKIRDNVNTMIRVLEIYILCLSQCDGRPQDAVLTRCMKYLKEVQGNFKQEEDEND